MTSAPVPLFQADPLRTFRLADDGTISESHDMTDFLAALVDSGGARERDVAHTHVGPVCIFTRFVVHPLIAVAPEAGAPLTPVEGAPFHFVTTQRGGKRTASAAFARTLEEAMANHSREVETARASYTPWERFMGWARFKASHAAIVVMDVVGVLVAIFSRRYR